MTKLYIIGNGFDLWHALPTGYDRFSEFARSTLEEVEEFYSFDLAQKGPWSDFENSLGRFNWRTFYEAHDNTDVTAEDFRPSEAYALDDDLIEQADNHVTAIKESFQKWIEGIDISVATKTIRFAPEDRFFTFNYTSTLQVVYGIEDERVFHIHGRADGNTELVFGHGESLKEEPEYDENRDSNRTMFSDAQNSAKYPFYAFQKPVSEILKKNRLLFESQRDISNIVVIGHSFNEIDLPYFRRLADCASSARWRVYFYNPAEREHHFKQLVKCGVPADRFQVYTYSDLENESHQ